MARSAIDRKWTGSTSPQRSGWTPASLCSSKLRACFLSPEPIDKRRLREGGLHYCTDVSWVIDPDKAMFDVVSRELVIRDVLLVQGISPRVVMEVLGHSEIALTMNAYSHVVPELKHEAAQRMQAILER
jgi:hypothetical protein